MQVVELTAQQTIPIRHKVLWPNELPEYCIVEGDGGALHLGVLIDNEVVSVASIYFNNTEQSARLRKFATLFEYQGRGIGSYLLAHIIDLLKKLNINYFWFDARASAVIFYKRLGFQTASELFYKNSVSYYRMHMNL